MNPWEAVWFGQLAHNELARAWARGRERADDEAFRRAAALMADEPYYPGFPGVERPNYLRELFRQNPVAAIQLEDRLMAPLIAERNVRFEGEKERAKRMADLEVANALLAQLSGAGEADPTTATSLAFGPGGVQIKREQMSNLAAEHLRKQMEIDQGKFDLQKEQKLQQEQQDAFDRWRALQEAIMNVQRMRTERLMSEQDAQSQLASLQEQAQQAKQAYDLLTGKQTTVVPQANPILPQNLHGAAGHPRRADLGLNEKEQAELESAMRKQKQELDLKDIQQAREAARKINQFRQPLAQLFELVNKRALGNPARAALPLGEYTLTAIDSDYAKLKNLNEILTNMFSAPGQSQLMNTIVERQMQAAQVPHIFGDPNQNRINAAILRSNMEHLERFPGFLEKWMKRYKSLDGATDAWIEYTEHNRLYRWDTSPRGEVKVSPNPKVIPIDRWLFLKEKGDLKVINGKVLIRVKPNEWEEHG